ncbi:MAG: histone deacetylase family protein [Nitrospinales bacterium]
MKKTGYIYDSFYLKHDTRQHPENPGRLSAINSKIDKSTVKDHLVMLEPRKATEKEISQNHDKDYVREVHQRCADGDTHLDGGDTVVCIDSSEAAVLSAGAGLTAVDQVIDGDCDNVFCAVRPPGHHAENNRAMGFCLFNNVAIAARYAQTQKKLDRVFIFDWDVHHGNGTQNSFYSDSSVFYSSIHQYPFYPGTGGKDETGTGDGLGSTLNFPLNANSNDEDYIAVIENKLIPSIIKFDPDLIIISAGFDAHQSDPLANMNVSTSCFGDMTKLILAAADEVCEGRLISMLEGGYDHEALGDSVDSHLKNLISL